MNKIAHLSSKLAIILCGPLLGYTAYSQPSVSVGVSVPLPSVDIEIRADSDFYEPLAPQGEWVTIGSYGRCWRPGHVARDWRPYCNGNWELTDAGWYWVSDEPWAWATYHYGRWDFADQYGWYWVPQTQWAPAWVSWHEGGGYVGWAPLQPSVTISVGGYVGFNQSRIPQRGYVFVEQRRFLEPIRPTSVVANNTTIINRTTIISNTRIVNKTVINGGPATAVVEKASGRKVQPVQVQELRHKQEAVVAARQKTVPATEKKVQPTVRTENESRLKKADAAPAPAQAEKPTVTPPAKLAPTGRTKEIEKARPIPSQVEPQAVTPRASTIKEPISPSHVEKPAATPHTPAPLPPTGRTREIEKANPVPPQARPQPETPRSSAIKEPISRKTDSRVEKQEKGVRPSEKQAQPVGNKAPATEKHETNPEETNHEKKIKD
jgi:Family of unknown function (DUF6600)